MNHQAQKEAYIKMATHQANQGLSLKDRRRILQLNSPGSPKNAQYFGKSEF